MYNSIVVGFDSSEFSKAALVESSQWVRRHGGTVSLVHAVSFNEEEFLNASEQLERRFEMGMKICQGSRDLVSAELGLNGNLKVLVCEGQPQDVLLDVALTQEADMIAMGTHGRKGLKRLLMGSVTSAVIVSAPCDVLVVKRPCHGCTGTYKRILLPYDGSAPSVKALGQACKLADIDGAEVTVLYVIPRYEEMIDFFKTVAVSKGFHDQARALVAGAALLGAEAGLKINTAIEEGSPDETIVSQAERLDSDLIVMGSHGWKGINKAVLGSTTERVIMNAHCPILIAR